MIEKTYTEEIDLIVDLAAYTSVWTDKVFNENNKNQNYFNNKSKQDFSVLANEMTNIDKLDKKELMQLEVLINSALDLLKK